MPDGSDHTNLPKLLLISPHLSSEARGGPALRTQQTVRTLTKLARLHVFDIDQGPDREYFGTRHQRLVSKLSAFLNPNRTRVGQLLQILFGTWTAVCYKAIANKIEVIEPDMVWINFVNEHSSLVRRIKSRHPRLAVVGDTDSVYSVFLRRTSSNMIFFRRYAYALLAYLQSKREERLSKELDVLTAVSEVDKSHYESLGGTAILAIFANVIEVPEKMSDRTKQDRNLTLLLPGSFGGPESAMTHGLRWFTEKVWPKVLLSLPSAELYVVGRNADSAIARDMVDRLTVASDVPDMGPFFELARVVICPLFFESGTRFKILEASKHQVPVVSTSLGAEGLSYVDGLDILIADDADSFAKACLALLEDEEGARQIGEAAWARLESDYSQRASLRQALEVFAAVEKVSRGRG